MKKMGIDRPKDEHALTKYKQNNNNNNNNNNYNNNNNNR